MNEVKEVTPKMLKMLGMTRGQYDALKLKESQGLLQDDIKQQHAQSLAKTCSHCSLTLYPLRYRCWECLKDLCEKCAMCSQLHARHLVSLDQVELVGPGRGKTVPRALTNALSKFASRPLFLIHESAEMASHLTATHLQYSWISYADVYHRAMNFSKGLCASSGYQMHGFVGICSSNRLEWVLADLALLLNGIVSVPITITSSKEEIQSIVRDCQLNAVVCSRDMASYFLFSGSTVRLVVLMQGTAVVEAASNVYITTFEAVESLGKTQNVEERLLESRGTFEELPDPSAQHLISLMYTSGSTGMPKGVMIGDYSWNSRFSTAGLSPVVGLEIVFLPLAHGTARSQYLGRLIDGGAVALFDKERHDQNPGGGYAVLFEHIRTLRPTHHIGVPRFWNVVFSEFTRSLSQAMDSRAPGVTRFKVTEDMYATYRTMFGDRLIAVGTGSAATSSEVLGWMRKCFKGLDCSDGYGTTETGGLSGGGRAQRDVELKLRDRPDLGFLTSDLPLPRGEILARSSGRALGYYNRPELSKEVFLEDGWYATGDIGELDVKNGEQYFHIIDRGGDVFKLAQGEFVVPSKIEGVMMASKYVSQIVVYGTSVQSSVVAVLVPQLLPHEELNHSDNINAVLADLAAVGRAAKLQGYEIPSSIWFDAEAWTPENKLLTPSLKANRPALLKKYRVVFDRLYTEQAVRLRDGLLENEEQLQSLLNNNQQLDSFSAVALSERMLREFSIRVSAISLMKAESKDELLDLVKSASVSVQTTVNWENEASLPSLPGLGKATSLCFDGVAAVLLTGSTGFLGAHLLEALLARTQSRVYCIVRGSEERLKNHLVRQRIQADYSRIRILVGDLSREHMGLDREVYEELENEIGCVLHNASHVNHALSYQDLKSDNVDGTRECLSLCVRGRSKVLVLVSTISVVLADHEASCEWEDYVAPEIQGGYVQSKWVQERMVRHGGFNLWGVPCITFRPGLIMSHSQTGASNPHDLIIRLLRSVAATRAAPALNQLINMVPVDFVAQAIVGLSLHCSFNNAAFNICNSQTVSLSSVFDAIHQKYPLEVLPYAEWLQEVSDYTPWQWVGSLHNLGSFRNQLRSATWEQLFKYNIEELVGLGIPETAAIPLWHCVASLGKVPPNQAPNALLPYVTQISSNFPSFNTFTTPLSTAQALGLQCPAVDQNVISACLTWLSVENS